MESLQPKALAARTWGLGQDRAVERRHWFRGNKRIWFAQCPSSLKKQQLHEMFRRGKSIETVGRLIAA